MKEKLEKIAENLLIAFFVAFAVAMPIMLIGYVFASHANH